MKKLLKGIGLLAISFASGANLYAESVQTPTTTDGTTSAQTLKAADVSGSVSVKVVDQNGYGLGGAQFTAYNSKNVATAVMTTDENGETVSKAIPAGKYTIRQTGEPKGFYENKTYYSATISSQGQVVDINGGANVINYPVSTNKAGNITGKVVDEKGYPVAGVKFNVYNTRNIVVTTVTTDENGEFRSKDLESGQYTIRQVAQPNGYYENKAYYSANITSDGQQVAINNGSNIVANKVKNANQVKGTISAKVINDEAKPLSGVTFTIFDNRNISIGTMTTDGNGNAQMANVEAGNYTIRQTGQPSEYYSSKQYYYANIDQSGEKVDINGGKSIVVNAIAQNGSSTKASTSDTQTTEKTPKDLKQAKTATPDKEAASKEKAKTEEKQSVIENIVQSISDFVVNIIDSIKNIFS